MGRSNNKNYKRPFANITVSKKIKLNLLYIHIIIHYIINVITLLKQDENGNVIQTETLKVLNEEEEDYILNESIDDIIQVTQKQ